MGVGAIVGGVKGANEAQREDVVDQTRVFLRTAIEDTDFTELLRARLASSKAAGDVEIINVTSQATPLAAVPDGGPGAGSFPGHRVPLGLCSANIWSIPLSASSCWRGRRSVNGSANQQLHQATWAYCGARYHFVQMAANYGAALRAQIDHAAAVLAEAIPYDLYVSKRPRASLFNSTCMDFSDLPSGIGRPPVPPRS